MMKKIKKAIESVKGGNFNCMPIPEVRDPEFQFDAEIHSMVEEAGCQLKWLDTFKGGCWHVIPIEE